MSAVAAAVAGALMGIGVTLLSKKTARKKAISILKGLIDKSDKELDKLQDKVIKDTKKKKA